MTDENERMNRAKRIRQMREGNRDGGDAGDEPSDAGGNDGETDRKGPDDGQADGASEGGQADGGSDDSGAEAEERTMEDPVAEDEKRTMEDLVTEANESASEGPDTDDGTTEPAEADDTTEGPPVDDGSETEAGVQDGDQQSAETEPIDDSEGVTAPLPDTETIEAALDEAEGASGEGDEEPTPAAGSAEVADADEATSEEETRVLEFTLDDENYCLDIEYIEEIVKEETITRVPNTPEYVAGVVDLRGQITTILNPKVTLGKENTEADELIVVFDSEAFEDQGHLGWVVDDVRQVSPIVESEVNDPPMEAEYINGVIDRGDDEGFVIWTSPDLALGKAD